MADPDTCGGGSVARVSPLRFGLRCLALGFLVGLGSAIRLPAMDRFFLIVWPLLMFTLAVRGLRRRETSGDVADRDAALSDMHRWREGPPQAVRARARRGVRWVRVREALAVVALEGDRKPDFRRVGMVAHARARPLDALAHARVGPAVGGHRLAMLTRAAVDAPALVIAGTASPAADGATRGHVAYAAIAMRVPLDGSCSAP